MYIAFKRIGLFILPWNHGYISKWNTKSPPPCKSKQVPHSQDHTAHNGDLKRRNNSLQFKIGIAPCSFQRHGDRILLVSGAYSLDQYNKLVREVEQPIPLQQNPAESIEGCISSFCTFRPKFSSLFGWFFQNFIKTSRDMHSHILPPR